ncbi:exodeoxyribonuclease III [Candidatus Dojkabacteria bacterium]|nr:exodeoxyribonuclease III [Candidatus Dojkabacteria bacterium]
MKILSWNVNGIRAVHRKNMTDWLFNESDADVICLQEIKADEPKIPQELISPSGYKGIFNPAQKSGYSGTAIYTKAEPNTVTKVFGKTEIDEEGRFIRVNYDEFAVLNFYIPNGGRDKDQLDSKIEFIHELAEYVEKHKSEPLVLVGDFNIARTEKDLAQPEENQDSVMFKPEERDAIAALINAGLVDTFREFNDKGGHYTWWAYWANSRARNLGWRIDYCFVTEALRSKLGTAGILAEITGSDHCPVFCELEL